MNLRKLIPSPLEATYHIGFVENPDMIHKTNSWYDSVRWIDSRNFDKEGWFADPFILSMDNESIVLLAEEYYYAINRGRLVKMTIRRNDYQLLRVEPILTLDTHLSYPIIWQEEQKTYIYPENYQGGALRLWEFDGYKLANPHVLIHEPLLDSQMIKIRNTYYIFGVKFEEGKWEDTRSLYIYQSNSLMGPYQLMQTIHNKKNEERGAGQIMQTNDGRILRPAQCCEGFYGKETIIYEMTLAGEKFEEKEIGRIVPNRKHKNGLVLHTFNEMNGIAVIDGLRWEHPILRKLTKWYYK